MFGNAMFQTTATPVSYTHLDVYKRQIQAYLGITLLLRDGRDK